MYAGRAGSRVKVITCLAGLATGYGVRNTTLCTGSAEAQRKASDSKRPHRVLIVGAGLTGALSAALIRRHWESTAAASSSSALPPLHLSIWERASYPAGRFGATALYEGEVADMGAQVLSIVVTDAEHEDAGQGGHGISPGAVGAAQQEAGSLAARGLLVPVDDAQLGATEERMLWEGIWRHHWAPGGLVSVLQAYLEEARPEALCFGRRVERIALQGPPHSSMPPRWQVAASEAGGSGGGGGAAGARAEVREAFDSVVLCVPAPDALRIHGLAAALPPLATHVLHSVKYDSRTSVAVFYDASLREAITALFQRHGVSEIALDLGCTAQSADPAAGTGSASDAGEVAFPPSDLHLLALQGAKGRSMEACCAVVAHSKVGVVGAGAARGSAWGAGGEGARHEATASKHGATERPEEEGGVALVDQVHMVMGAGLGLPPEQLRGLCLSSKVVDWQVSQMIAPMEAVLEAVPECSCLTNVPRSSGSALTGETTGTLVVAGDYMTQSSFLGCLSSALEASQVVADAASMQAAK